jgi:hypothetical protein
MQVDDSHRIALKRIGRTNEHTPNQRPSGQSQPQQQTERRGPAGDTQETGGIGKTVHDRSITAKAPTLSAYAHALAGRIGCGRGHKPCTTVFARSSASTKWFAGNKAARRGRCLM